MLLVMIPGRAESRRARSGNAGAPPGSSKAATGGAAAEAVEGRGGEGAVEPPEEDTEAGLGFQAPAGCGGGSYPQTSPHSPRRPPPAPVLSILLQMTLFNPHSKEGYYVRA